jgi:hypothetical protein
MMGSHTLHRNFACIDPHIRAQGGTFTGTATKKKAAQRAAADAAFASLKSQPTWQAAVIGKARPKQESLLSAVAETLSDKVRDLLLVAFA